MSDYRSHLSVTIWAVLVALALGAIVHLPERVFTLQILGSPLSFNITADVLAGLVAVTVVCAGLEAAIRTHPSQHLLRHTYRYWGLPAAIVMTCAAILPAAPSDAWWMAALLGSGMILAAAALAEYHTIDPEDRYYHSARLVLNALAYFLAAAAFILIYSARSRSLISASLIGVIAGLLALDLLRGSNRPLRMALLYGAITALVMAQTTWVLNYWPYTSLRVGLILLVIFYLLVGLAHQELLGRLTRRRAAEYLFLAGVTTIALIGFPG